MCTPWRNPRTAPSETWFIAIQHRPKGLSLKKPKPLQCRFQRWTGRTESASGDSTAINLTHVRDSQRLTPLSLSPSVPPITSAFKSQPCPLALPAYFCYTSHCYHFPSPSQIQLLFHPPGEWDKTPFLITATVLLLSSFLRFPLPLKCLLLCCVPADRDLLLCKTTHACYFKDKIQAL